MCTHTTYEPVFVDTNRSINISVCTHLYETIHELMLSPTLIHSLWIILDPPGLYVTSHFDSEKPGTPSTIHLLFQFHI